MAEGTARLPYEEMVGLYGQEALDLAGYPGPETRIVSCPSCDGDCGWDGDVHPLYGIQWIQCRYCDGNGEVEIKAEARTLDDLEDEDAEASASLKEQEQG